MKEGREEKKTETRRDPMDREEDTDISGLLPMRMRMAVGGEYEWDLDLEAVVFVFVFVSFSFSFSLSFSSIVMLKGGRGGR